jgi:hypothetical protein
MQPLQTILCGEACSYKNHLDRTRKNAYIIYAAYLNDGVLELVLSNESGALIVTNYRDVTLGRFAQHII